MKLQNLAVTTIKLNNVCSKEIVNKKEWKQTQQRENNMKQKYPWPFAKF